MIVVPYRPQDYLEAAGALMGQAGKEWLAGWDIKSTAWGFAQSPAWTARDGRVLLGCAGVQIMWRGRGMAWALLTPAGQKHPRFMTWAVRRGLRDAIQKHHLIRVEADVEVDNPLGQRWVRLLGFSEESLMPKWSPQGHDAIRYVLFPKEPV